MMIGRRAEVLPVECVVRGYLAGSGWAEYRATGEVCGVALPAGLRESDRLPEPIFTPADEGRPRASTTRTSRSTRVASLIGHERAAKVRDASLAALPARRRGVRASGHHPRRHEVRVRGPADGELS